MRQYTQFYIDGQWVDPASGWREFQLVNPATEQPFATVPLGNAQDVDRAVQAARRAFPAFSAMSTAVRIEMLQRIVDAFAKREADFMAVASEEMGTPLSSVSHFRNAVDQFREAIKVLQSYELEHWLGGNLVRREPIGVCGLIAPWNWPIQTPCTKLASAFAAGCTVVLKPSEYTPLSMVLLAEVLHEAAVPAGVFNLVIGDGPGVGHAISAHPGIDMVSFTGSTRAGIAVAETAASTVKRVCQELGGKSANVVLPDADLEAAARWNVARGTFNTGQSCHSPSRILVHESQAAQMAELLKREIDKLVVGDPKSAKTNLGPAVNKSQFERIQHYIQVGLDDGARLVSGGLGRPPSLERGYFVRPTLFADVRPDMRIAQEEIFGPVLSLLSYRTEDEAVEIANGTVYGLGAYVFASTPQKARGVAERLRAGRVFINGANSNPAAPMGGYKQSGNGREMGVFGLEEFLEVKVMIGLTA
jgi:aldehyde dehydrogenase (NAD+)